MSRRQRQQRGHVFKKSAWWWLRYREDIVENGELRRRQLARRLEPVRPEHGRLKRPPPEVLVKAEAILRPINSGAYNPLSTQTLAEYVEGKYFPDQELLLRASTLTGYQHRWEFLKPYCGQLRLRNFTTHDGQTILNDIARQHRQLLRTTLQHMKSLLSGFFTYAISLGILDGQVTIDGTRKTVFGNPMRAVRVPRAAEGEDTYAYSLEEIVPMILHLPQPARTAVATCAFTGVRRGELAGLLWENYDGTTLRVTRSVWEGHVDEPKTRKSRAPVPLVPQLRAILDAYRLECGNPISGPLFSSRAGTPLNMNNVLNRAILPALKKAGIEWHGWHAFRRGLATNLNALGTDDSVIQSILRHSHVSVTQACYIKTIPRQSVEAMNRLADQLDRLCTDCAPTQPQSTLTH